MEVPVLIDHKTLVQIVQFDTLFDWMQLELIRLFLAKEGPDVKCYERDVSKGK